MSLFQRFEFCRIRIGLRPGNLNEFNKRVGDTAHRRNDRCGAFASSVLRSKDAGDSPVAGGIGDAGAAEFMNDPLHVRHYNCAIISAGFQ